MYSAPEKSVQIPAAAQLSPAAKRTSAVQPPAARRFGRFAGVAAVALLALTGCGVQYRPVVSAVNPVGPAGQPTKFAVVISQPTPTGPGLLNMIDFSGDTIVNTTTIGNGPKYLNLSTAGGIAYVINSDNTINNATVSTSLIASQVDATTLLAGAAPASLSFVGSYLYVAESGRNAIGQFSQNSPPGLLQEFPLTNPVYTLGASGALRTYTIGSSSTGAGLVAALETSTSTESALLNVGRNPVYGVMTPDTRRAFIMNKGDNTVSVINVLGNTLDVAHPTLNVGVAPVWADLITAYSEIAVLNAGNGTSNGSVSIINIPLCSSSAPVGNPNCDVNNPIDANGFGTTLATIPVGKNPNVISVLADGSLAYVANAGDTVTCPSTIPAASINPTKGCGTVSVINLTTNSVIATIPVAGHPNFLVATTGNPTGKVYVTSSETSLLTVLRTDINAVEAYLELQGTGQMVRVTAQ